MYAIRSYYEIEERNRALLEAQKERLRSEKTSPKPLSAPARAILATWAPNLATTKPRIPARPSLSTTQPFTGWSIT